MSVQLEHFRFGSFEKNQYFLTADNIELRINATIFYRISDVRTMFSTRIKDPDDLRDTLHSQAMATLLTIIRSESFHNIGQRGQTKSMGRDVKEGFQFGGEEERGIPTARPLPSPPPRRPSRRMCWRVSTWASRISFTTPSRNSAR